MARPSGLNDISEQKVVEAIRRGNSRDCVARQVGVTARTLQLWMRKDSRFLRRVREADGEAENLAVDALYKLATGAGGERPHFEALKFWLKTRRAKTWRELQASPAPEPSNDLSGKSEEELVAAVEKWMAERKAKVG